MRVKITNSNGERLHGNIWYTSMLGFLLYIIYTHTHTQTRMYICIHARTHTDIAYMCVYTYLKRVLMCHRRFANWKEEMASETEIDRDRVLRGGPLASAPWPPQSDGLEFRHWQCGMGGLF